MCLKYQDSRLEDKYKGIDEGYKIVVVVPSNREYYRFLYLGVGKIPIGRWINEREYRPLHINTQVKMQHINDKEGKTYPTGFHIYLNEEDAEKSWYIDYTGETITIIIKVKFKNPVAWGYGNISNAPCVVAKDIFVKGVV